MLLKNNNKALPLNPNAKIYVAGSNANDIGNQGARALAQSPRLSGLRSLSLEFNNVGEGGLVHRGLGLAAATALSP